MPFLKRAEGDAQNAHQVEQVESSSGERVTFWAVYLGLVASIGGFMFGYVSGQISGFFLMQDYAHRFGELQANGQYTFSPARQGTIVGLLAIGSMIGALISGRLADIVGRKRCISIAAFFTCVGVIIEISSSTHWVQFAIGRLVDGCGMGALSVVVPMYQSESAPSIIRGVLVASYQLFVTLGIWTAEMINYGTEALPSGASWRIPNGMSFLWALILGVGILFLPESPRYAYRRGREEEARNVIGKLAGVAPDSRVVDDQIASIRVKLEEENAGTGAWIEIFTGPRMFYRTILGMSLQAGQQLVGANFFFYFGTTVFAATGLSNGYVTQIILGSVNVFCTFGGLYVIQKFGRRKSLMAGAAWMSMCFLVYAFVGHFALNRADPMSTPQAGNVLIVFSCLAIAAFASTWGPLVWAVVAELYPSRYRAQCLALATATNWLFNFLISFFTTFITSAIDYFYGLVFAGCCATLVFIVFFFLIESKGRSLEEIDTMYVLKVNPITSAKWDGSRVPRDGMTSSEEGSERAQSKGKASGQGSISQSMNA